MAGAGIGGLTRYIAATWIMAKYGGRFPLGTLIINVSGSFLIGAFMTGLAQMVNPHPYWRLFLVVGVLGGYTTFSSFEFEMFQAARDGSRLMAVLYMASSVILGFAGVWIGTLLVSRR